MTLTLRTRIMALVATTAMTFIILIYEGSVLMNQMQEELIKIQENYLPIIEHGPRIQSAFEQISRSLLDGVTAQDPEALEKSQENKAHFLNELKSIEKVADPKIFEEVRASLEDDYPSALEVSQHLIRGTAGASLTAEISQMQAKQAKLGSLVKAITTLDKGKVLEAFSTIAQTQRTSGKILIVLCLFCLMMMTVQTLRLSHTLLRSVNHLSQGFLRFGQGDFSQEIPILRKDELGTITQQANQMGLRLQGLLKELESFSYSVAHDLRTPLRSIFGFCTIILDEHEKSLPQEVKESLNRVTAASQKMGSLIDGLLSLSQLARKDLKNESVDLTDKVLGILNDFQSSHLDRKITTQVEQHITVQGDSRLLEIVLANLLGNALKFTSKKAESRIEFGKKVKNGQPVYFIKDNGAGFDMEHAKKLFETFHRLHSHDEFEGTGIGLATVLKIIKRHGGEIWAESKPDQGATFFFTLWTNTLNENKMKG